MEAVTKPRLTPGLCRIVMLLGGVALFLWQIQHPFARFVWAPLNSLCFLIVLLLPWLALLQLLLLGRRWLNLVGIVAGIFLLLATPLALGMGLLFSGMLGVEQVAETPWLGSTVRVYWFRTGGLSHDFIRVRQEKAILPGLVLVRDLEDFDLRDFEPRIETKITRDGVELRDLDIRHGPYSLKRFVYF
jgi:hypothetical protein